MKKVVPCGFLALSLTVLGPAQTALLAADDGANPDAARQRPELEADVVYAVLVAELAMQRGDHRMAFTHYLHAARLANDPEMAERAVRAALADGSGSDAGRALDLWTALAPDSPKATQLAAFVALESGDREAALSALRRVVDIAADRGQGYLQAAQLLGRVTDPGERLHMMEQLVPPDLNDPDALYALATLAAAADEKVAAERYAARAVELRPGWNKPRLLAVRLVLASEDVEQAEQLLSGYLQDTPNDRDLLLLRGQLHIDADEPEQALALFERVLAAEPDNDDVLFAAGVLALEVEDLVAARDYLLRLRETGGRDDETALLLGQVEELAGNDGEALSWYERVGGANKTDARVRIAGLYAKQGAVAEARELLQQLRDRYPADATTLYLIEGELLRDQDMDQEAIGVYSSGLERHPDDPDLLYARAMLSVGMDRVDLLERDLRRILVSDPDHADALNALGYTLADRTDRLDEAFRFVQRALELRPDEPAILDSMGWVLYRQGKPEQAEPYLRQALDKLFDPEIAAHLGEVLWELGRRDEALAIWRRAYREDPGHEYLLKVMSRYGVPYADAGQQSRP